LEFGSAQRTEGSWRFSVRDQFRRAEIVVAETLFEKFDRTRLTGLWKNVEQAARQLNVSS